MRTYPATKSQLISWIAYDRRQIDMGHLPPARVNMLSHMIEENEARIERGEYVSEVTK